MSSVGFWQQIALNILSGTFLPCLPGEDFISFPRPSVERALSSFLFLFRVIAVNNYIYAFSQTSIRSYYPPTHVGG